MPVRRFRSIEEMSEPRWYAPGDPALHAALRRLWSLADRTLQPRFPPGVHRHRSIEDMNATQAAWDEANFRAYQDRQAREKARLEAEERRRS